MVIETQTRRQHGAVGQFHVVFSKQRENFRIGVRAAVGAAVTWDITAHKGLRIGEHILHALLIPLGTERQVLVDQQVQWNADFTVQHDVIQVGIDIFL